MGQRQINNKFNEKINFLINKSLDTERFERKIPLRKGQSILFRNQLLENGFYKVFSKRNITSIYFDTDDLFFARQNINGENLRVKPRVRFYDNQVNYSALELKFKNNYSGYKNKFYIKKKINFKSVNNIYINNFSNLVKKILGLNLYPTTIVTYERTYYNSKFIRATQDENIKVFRLHNYDYFFQNYNTKIFSPLDLEVIEFKYDVSKDNFFRKKYDYLFNKTLRAKKCSKYIHSIINSV